MAVYNEEIIDVELESGTVARSFVNHRLGEGDTKGNRFGFRAFRGGEPVSLSSVTVKGYFVRADGTTIVINGAVSGNTAYVILPQNCYAVEGSFTLTIKAVGGGVTGTMRIVDGTVVNTTTGSVVDPGGAVPDIDALTAVIERAEDAAETIADFAVSVELNSDADYTLVVDTE